MSSRSKRKGGGGKYPTPWSGWVWSEQYQRHYRSRLRGPEDWEYEYEQPEDQPRTPQEPSLAPSAPENYPQDKNYTHRSADAPDIDSLAEDLAGASISPVAGSYPPSGVYPSTASSGSYPPSGIYPSTASSGTYPTAGTGAYPSAASTGTFPSLASAGTYSGAATYSAQSYGQQTYASPTPGWQNHIKTRDPYTDREEFDPHYKVHGGWAFKWGKIFKVLWAEPKGAEGAGSAGQSGTESLTVRKGAGGKETFAKVRRFVIIKPMEGHCICLPILTYSGQGVNKRGVHADHHAIIYSGKKPVAFRGEREKGLTMRSIKVTPDNPRHKLDDASRLNYAKTYTVEYNVKVWFIGKVSSDSEWQIRTDYNRVHPPLEIKGVRPPDTPDDTYEHAGGGTYAGSYPAAYSSAGYTASYGSSSAYPQATSPTYGVSETISEQHEHAQDSTSANYSSYFPASAAANTQYGSSSTGYGAGSYGSSGTTTGGYGPGGYYGSASADTGTSYSSSSGVRGHSSSGSGYERRDLDSVDERHGRWAPEEQTDRQRGQSHRRRGDQEHEDDDGHGHGEPPPPDDHGDLYDDR